MKSLMLLASVFIITSCAHKNWCSSHPDNQASNTAAATTFESDLIEISQAAPTRNEVATASTQNVTVKQIQAKLNELGHKSGSVDGIVGSITTGALTRFQKENKLSVTGKINEETIASLEIEDTIE